MTNVRYRFGRHALDLAKRELLHDDAAVALPARVFECLVHLIEHRERAVDRDELAQAVFSRSDVSDAQLAQIILRSRRAIGDDGQEQRRSEEHTSELQSLMRISYAVFCLKKKKNITTTQHTEATI